METKKKQFNGYIKVFSPGHPNRDGSNYVFAVYRKYLLMMQNQQVNVMIVSKSQIRMRKMQTIAYLVSILITKTTQKYQEVNMEINDENIKNKVREIHKKKVIKVRSM